ncbi:heat-inducible transcription repressor hrcA [Eggerthella sp. CAG:368]|nr:heat-inducible transcription repressor hrcA [Eggerthella sp. CAG:368]
MLSDRRQNVLRVLIEEYIARALPVGSRTLVERYNLGISSATVRNELSSLEEEGYLVQPHTSSGRIPTDYGYRAFVDDLLAREKFDDENLVKALRESAGELDELMEKTSRALARLTDCMTLVVPPCSLSFDIKVVNLIELTPQRLLLVVVTNDGQVFNRQIETKTTQSAEEIAKTQDLLNRLLAGKSLSSKSDDVSSLLDGVQDDLFQLVLSELMDCLKDQSVKKPHSLGMTHLLCQPEFSESARILPVLEQLEDDAVLLHIFDEAFNSEAPLVRIGHENDSEAFSGVSLIASQFGGGKQRGLIAIIGPTRMNYSQVFKAVRAAKNVLQNL